MTGAQSEKIIGCVDGTVIRVVTEGDEIHLQFEGEVAPLSRLGAALLAAALDPDTPASKPVAPSARSPYPPPLGTSRRMGAGANPSVGGLVAEGYLDEGAMLSLTHHGREYTATVTGTGEVEHNGVLHGSLSAAAIAATGATAMNGWAAWHAGEDGPIANLRWRLRADHFPGEGHRFSDKYATEMRMVARWWVDHTLSAGLDPGMRTEAEIEALLGGSGYAESTLDSYRRHLHNWFALYGKGVTADDESEHDNDSHAAMP